MTTRGGSTTVSESFTTERKLSPILANYEKVKRYAGNFEQRLFTDELPVDALFGPNTANIPRRHLKYLDETKPMNREGSTTVAGVPCVYLVTRKPGRKKARRNEQEAQEKSKGIAELRKMVVEAQRETLNWSSSSLEYEEETEEKSENTSRHPSNRVKNLQSFYGSKSTIDKNQQRSIKIFTSKKEIDRMRSTLGRVQPRPEAEPKRQKPSNASVSRNLNDDEDVLSSIKLKWEPSELLKLFDKVGLGSLTANTEERIAKSLKNLERDCKKYCDELSSDTDEESPDDYSMINKKKKEAPLKQLDPASKFLTKFSKIVGKKEVDGANITKVMIDEVIPSTSPA